MELQKAQWYHPPSEQHTENLTPGFRLQSSGLSAAHGTASKRQRQIDTISSRLWSCPFPSSSVHFCGATRDEHTVGNIWTRGGWSISTLRPEQTEQWEAAQVVKICPTTLFFTSSSCALTEKSSGSYFLTAAVYLCESCIQLEFYSLEIYRIWFQY